MPKDSSSGYYKEISKAKRIDAKIDKWGKKENYLKDLVKIPYIAKKCDLVQSVAAKQIMSKILQVVQNDPEEHFQLFRNITKSIRSETGAAAFGISVEEYDFLKKKTSSAEKRVLRKKRSASDDESSESEEEPLSPILPKSSAFVYQSLSQRHKKKLPKIIENKYESESELSSDFESKSSASKVESEEELVLSQEQWEKEISTDE